MSQNSKEHTFGRVSFLFKKRLWHVCFPVSFTNFLRTPFLWSTSDGCFLNSLMSDVELNQIRVGIRNFLDLNFSVSKSYFNSKNHLLLDVFSVVSKRSIDNIMQRKLPQQSVYVNRHPAPGPHIRSSVSCPIKVLTISTFSLLKSSHYDDVHQHFQWFTG